MNDTTSVLRPMFAKMKSWEENDTPLATCQQEAVQYVSTAPFKKKGKAVINRQEMIDIINAQVNRNDLEIYLGNSLLAFEGLRTIKSRQEF